MDLLFSVTQINIYLISYTISLAPFHYLNYLNLGLFQFSM
jgi:hypothetical protein